MKKVYLIMGVVEYEQDTVLRAYARECDAKTCVREFKKMKSTYPNGVFGVYDGFDIKEMVVIEND